MIHNNNLPDIDSWMINAMQGLTFWVGYQHTFYSSYPLVEGALVAELRKLLQIQLPPSKRVLPERMYKKLLPPNVPIHRSTTRADLVIVNADGMGEAKGNIAKYVEYVIEVKRACSMLKERNSDLRRVCEYLAEAGPNKRGFLLVASESGIPDDYVSSHSGTSRRGCKKILSEAQKLIGHYRIRRTCKAAKTFRNVKSAHYTCLLEVFPIPPNIK